MSQERITGLFIGLIAGMFIATAIDITVLLLDHSMPGRMIIAHDCAHYDPQTGDFTWNKP